ncbi:zinc finger HIT domain-containing protein 2 [Megalops cyprinoides]|uniref:zinc finger HIT domain-containing protein 2 n=1 Tax=Megalops cyprinoides TaxID=118141 RepID=UPI001863E9C8|nr:zinc finger HIT domain-containing protein 2 [Megalops cyprinoides]
MNLVPRRKIPSSLRALLTDIGPRDELQYCTEASDAETEAVNVDGIALPGRGVASPEELLSPSGKKDDRVCGLCLSKPPSYTCPRCNVPYCGLACYRSPAHSACSEEFYKESVIQELKRTGETEEEGKRRMQEILVRLRKEGEGKEGGVEGVLREMEGEEGDGTLGNTQVLVLLSRLAEIQSSGEGDREEIEDILAKLKEIGEKDGEGGDIEKTLARLRDMEEEEGGEEEEEEEVDLAERLSGLDINCLSEEQLWDLLPRRDKERFEGLVKGGTIGGLVPLWTPWWETHEGGQGALIELLGGEEDEEEHKVNTKPGDGDSMEAGGRVKARQLIKTVEEEEKGEGGSQRKRTRIRVGEEEGGPTHLGRQRTDGAVMVEGKNKDEEQHRGAEGKEACEKGVASQAEQGQQQQKRRRTPKKESKVKSPSASVPHVNRKIPPLQSLSPQASPLVRYTLVNALYGYTFSLSLFNGDLSEPDLIQEFCQVVLAVSEALSSNRVFSSIQEALEAGIKGVTEGGYFDREDPGAPGRAVEAVAHVLTGRSQQNEVGYSLAALSELHAVLNQARGALSKEGDDGETRRRFFLAAKKCEFLQSWVKENGPAVRLLARGVWREYRRREKERKALDKEKKVVEESRKKGRVRGKGTLIEEMD